MKLVSLLIILSFLVGGAIYLFGGVEEVDVKTSNMPEAIEFSEPTSTIPAVLPSVGNEPKLKEVPIVVFGEYMSGWSAGLRRRMDPFMKQASSSGINAVVIDIKDYSGYVSYKMQVPGVISAGADKEIRVTDIDQLIHDLHAHDIYIIGRITVFQDTVLSKARPELALKDKRTGGLWRDRKGLAWLDPAGKETWDYTVEIAKDGFERGFDEINFDYIRFPSDGDLSNAEYPFWDKEESRSEVIREFFSHLRRSLSGRKISADLFGLTTVAKDDLGIGQLLEDALPYFDYVSPMIYPSHYANGFEGYKNPAEEPYAIVKHSMEKALERRQKMEDYSFVPLAKFRPWLQAFDMGAVYTPQKIKEQMRALDDVFETAPEAYAGWLLWDPSNLYKNYPGTS